jgi:hypothetical protein
MGDQVKVAEEDVDLIHVAHLFGNHAILLTG